MKDRNLKKSVIIRSVKVKGVFDVFEGFFSFKQNFDLGLNISQATDPIRKPDVVFFAYQLGHFQLLLCTSKAKDFKATSI